MVKKKYLLKLIIAPATVVLAGVVYIFSIYQPPLAQKGSTPGALTQNNTAISPAKTALVTIGQSVVEAELALTPLAQAKGLSGREAMDERGGMLFVFAYPDHHSFWMKDMLFPIDIIWVGEDETIIDVTANLSPSSFPQSFSPSAPAKYALEVNGGWSEINQARVGQAVFINYQE